MIQIPIDANQKRLEPMKVYQINYDLRKQRNYDALYQRIKAYGTWCRALESCWVIATNQSAAEVRDDLMLAMDADDGLLVTRLSGEAAWIGLGTTVSQWLKTQLEGQAA
jgi:hypothetical protein